MKSHIYALANALNDSIIEAKRNGNAADLRLAIEYAERTIEKASEDYTRIVVHGESYFVHKDVAAYVGTAEQVVEKTSGIKKGDDVTFDVPVSINDKIYPAHIDVAMYIEHLTKEKESLEQKLDYVSAQIPVTDSADLVECEIEGALYSVPEAVAEHIINLKTLVGEYSDISEENESDVGAGQ